MGVWLTIGVLVVSSLIRYFSRPKTKVEKQRPKGLGDFNYTTATEGRPIPVIFGRVRTNAANMLWYGDLGSEQYKDLDDNPLGYKYTLGLQFGLCRGPITNLQRIWVGDTKVHPYLIDYDDPITSVTPWKTLNITDLFGGQSEGSSQRGGIRGIAQVYFGTTTQTVDPYLNTQQTPCVPHRGTCYVVFKGVNDDLVTANGKGGYVGNDTSMDEWGFEIERYPNTLGTSDGSHKVGNAAGPVHVIYELLTDDEYGIGEGRTSIDVAGFMSAAATLASEQNGFAFLWDSESSIKDVISEIERQIDGVLYYDHATGTYKIKLFRLDYYIPTLPIINETMIETFEEKTESSWDETFNIVRVEFSDPKKAYEQSFALAQDPANQAVVGRSNTTTIAFPGCKAPNLANALAWRELRQLSYPGARFTFVVNRSLYGIKFGDVYQLNYKNFNTRVRILSVDYGDINDNRIRIVAVRESYRNEPGSFAAPEDTLWSAAYSNLIGLNAADMAIIEAPKGIVEYVSPGAPFPQLATFARKQVTGNELAKFYRLLLRRGTSSGGETSDYTVDEVINTGFTFRMTLRAGILGLENGLPAYGAETFYLDPLAGEDFSTFPPVSLEQWTNDPKNGIGVFVFDPGTANEEFVIVSKLSQTSPTGSLKAENVYRGALDSRVKPHSAGASLWFVWGFFNDAFFTGKRYSVGLSGAMLPDSGIPEYFKVKFLPAYPGSSVSSGDVLELSEGSVTAYPRQMQALLPVNLKINDVYLPATANSHFAIGSGQQGLKFSFLRRNWRTVPLVKQAKGLNTDGTPFTNPVPDDLLYDWRIYDLTADPTATTPLLYGTTPVTPTGGDTFVIPRVELVIANGGFVLPGPNMRIKITAYHRPAGYPEYLIGTPGAPTYISSREVLSFDFVIT